MGVLQCVNRIWLSTGTSQGKIERDGKGYATNRMPLWVKPNRKVDVLKVMDFMRDHLEGTELDMSKDPGAGPYECPYRWRPMSFEVDGKEYVHERATATQQTGFYICITKPQLVAGCSRRYPLVRC